MTGSKGAYLYVRRICCGRREPCQQQMYAYCAHTSKQFGWKTDYLNVKYADILCFTRVQMALGVPRLNCVLKKVSVHVGLLCEWCGEYCR